MDNNDILRRLRYALDLRDRDLAPIFALSGTPAPAHGVKPWLFREEDPEFKACRDKDLARFLNGFITHKRGPKPGPAPAAEKRLTNNLILLKLKIALDLKAEDVLELLALADLTLSPHELSAFFRRPGHKHFRECKDQVLRRFLTGLTRRHRPESRDPDKGQNPWARAMERL